MDAKWDLKLSKALFTSKYIPPVPFLKYEALKTEIKGAFSRSQCCYGNLLCHENNSNVFNSDWAVS